MIKRIILLSIIVFLLLIKVLSLFTAEWVTDEELELTVTERIDEYTRLTVTLDSLYDCEYNATLNRLQNKTDLSFSDSLILNHNSVYFKIDLSDSATHGLALNSDVLLKMSELGITMVKVYPNDICFHLEYSDKGVRYTTLDVTPLVENFDNIETKTDNCMFYYKRIGNNWYISYFDSALF